MIEASLRSVISHETLDIRQYHHGYFGKRRTQPLGVQVKRFIFANCLGLTNCFVI
jgi:hypothetical protein